jgi:phosphoserine phosphatase
MPENRESAPPTGSSGTLWVCDFDGTLYRGWLSRFTHGISNTDLFFQILLRSSGWRHAGRLISGGWQIRQLHRGLRERYQRGEIPLGEKDAQCINALRRLLHEESNEWAIRWAGRALANGLDRRALAVLADWVKPNDRVLILSKALLPVLLPAALNLSSHLACPVEVIGNRADRDDGILRTEDKERELRRFLASDTCTRAVVLGDTEEDIGMRDVLVTQGLPTHLIAVAPKDARIRDAADTVLPNWRHASSHPFAD